MGNVGGRCRHDGANASTDVDPQQQGAASPQVLVVQSSSKVAGVVTAAHLFQLHVAARARGVGIPLVIFDAAFLPKLFATPRGAYLRQNLSFMKGKPWVRHDEHYHVDFAVSCKANAGQSVGNGFLLSAPTPPTVRVHSGRSNKSARSAKPLLSSPCNLVPCATGRLP